MTDYREILRLKSLGISERNIALSCSCSRNTVAKVAKQALAKGLTWPLDASLTNALLHAKLFPKEIVKSTKRMPDYSYIRKELLRNGVTKKLLWTEYMEELSQVKAPQFLYPVSIILTLNAQTLIFA
jgi:hypothetical protein